MPPTTSGMKNLAFKAFRSVAFRFNAELAHTASLKLLSLTARRLVAEVLPGPPALLDVDGETPGRLPATFTILPAVLKFRC